MAKAKKMWALPGAELTAPASLLMHGGDATLLQLPCPSFLIEHPKGLVLFDSGCNPKIIDDAAGYWGQVAEHLPIKWSKSETLDKQIAGVGYKPSDVKYVILSHSHLDHSGGLTHFPNATFLVGSNELRYAYWPDADRRWAFILNDFVPTRGYKWLELDNDFDLFGDGSMQFLLTPGHTPGECSLMVNLPNRTFLLTGDTVHLRAALDLEAGMPIDTDPIQSMKSIHRLKAIRDMQGATLWITHDPDDWKEHPHRVE
ncbi:MAG TPA: N-acyl homoserine lactonase family protein [Candidatus Binataceae bacterium]|nr:N-acyl homoserine lactonase family protein [Candidatus Binataceae bacterium]